MYKAQVITWWTQGVDEEGNPTNTPHINTLRNPGESWMDVTGQPTENINPDPNMFVVELWCSQATLDAIAAHPDYGPEAILTSEEIVDESI